MPHRLILPAANEPYTLVESPKPKPLPSQVLIKVHACGLCGGDEVARKGLMPDLVYPLQAGHEIVGEIESVGQGVKDTGKWHVGRRVGVGWHAGHCFTCHSCLLGDFNGCANAHATGLTTLGGLGEYCTAEESALVAIPETMTATTAAPLLCAGLTAYNAIRRSRATLGDHVAVVGMGGIALYAVLFARAAGLQVSVFSRNPVKRDIARSLGAHHFYELSEDGQVGEDDKALILQSGGLDVVLATAPNANSMITLVACLNMDGEVLLIGEPPGPLSVEVIPLLLHRGSLIGWTAGTNAEAEQCLARAEMLGIAQASEPWLEVIGLEAAETRASASDARLRCVVQLSSRKT